MLLTIYKSLRKSYKLKKVYSRLAIAQNPNAVDLYLNDLIDIMVADDNVCHVMSLYLTGDDSFDRRVIKGMYFKLCELGAGQFARGHYVAAASFAYAYSLKFILTSYNGKRFSVNNHDERNSDLYVVERLFRYFANGKSGAL